jgi:superfamily II DNA or RNA helicase
MGNECLPGTAFKISTQGHHQLVIVYIFAAQPLDNLPPIVASKHKEAQTFLRKKFFEGLKSFREFEERTETLANTKEVGDALEILVEAHLHLDPVLKAKNVWVVGDIPLNIRKSLNLPADSKGIDGVYEDASGNIIPYQVKYRTDKETLPYGEVSSFLGITEESLKDRVIFTNARNLAADITKRKGLRSFKAAQFHSLTEEDFDRIHAWLSDKKPAFHRWTPRPHQKEAIEKITAALKVADRTTAVMACGTGKTLVALWAAEAQNPKTVLVLVPSLALLSQTLPEWCKQTSWGDRFRYLCVCSDSSVDRSANEDEYTLKQSDLEFSVTTEAKVVKDFLSTNQSGVKVIFSTYQSAEVVAEGLEGKTIDLGIFDEAHKTTGPREGLFAFGLNDKNIQIGKRLFLTATPRHYDFNKRNKDGDMQVVSMSDEATYGKVSYRLSFSDAVAADIIVPYKVIISVSLNKEVDAQLLRQGSTMVSRDEIQAKWVANQIALKRSIERTGATKVITFHSRVNLAKDFAGDNAKGFKEHVKGFDVFHVNGSQSASERKSLLEAFKLAPNGLITNARCLTEGVDVPAVDMVAFIDPRQSKVDIAQAAGRAMRKSNATNKKLGYIVVPLFIEQNKEETEDEALARSGFEEVAMVLGAMLENDEDLIDIIKEMQEARGRGDKFNPKQFRDKIEVIGQEIELEELTQSIGIQILDRLGVSWDRWFGLLQKFYAREGHSLVTRDHKESGLNLGNWASNQRKNVSRLATERIERLNSLGFVWDPYSDQWEKAYTALVKYAKREGNTLVPHRHSEDGINLGVWAGTQRAEKESLSPERIKRLNLIGFSWDPHSHQWEKYFEALVSFKKKNGHCRVPKGHNPSDNELEFYHWVNRQRKHKSKLSSERISRLDSIGFSWDPYGELWENGFKSLTLYHKREGSALVPLRHLENGFNLGIWVSSQRKEKGKLSVEKINRLNSLGFVWDPIGDAWEQNFESLKAFQNREGHCRVPSVHEESGLSLGRWAQHQRERKGKLSAERIKRLNDLGFSWDPIGESWEKHFEALVDFKKREGHANIPTLLVINGLFLGRWVSNQRTDKARLPTERINRLNSVGFVWDSLALKWENGFKALINYSKREGHTQVPHRHKEDGISLGVWVGAQRKNKGDLSPEQIKRLNAIGFAWKAKR